MIQGLISADGHVEEAPDLWTTRLPARYRDRAPTIAPLPDGQRVLFMDGKPRAVPGLSVNRGDQRGAWDVVRRVEDLDSQGIAMEVLYPQWTMVLYNLGLEEPEFEYEVLHAYNDWLAGFSAAAPGRFLPIGLLPVHDIDLAVKELDHIRGLGLAGVNIPQSRPELFYNSSGLAPLWEALDDAGLPVSIHAGIVMEHRGVGAVAANVVRNLGSFRNTFPILVYSGILDRYRNVRLVLTEGGLGWLAPTLHDMDMVYEEYARHIGPELSALPSEIWRRQCFCTFQDDPAGMRCLDLVDPSTLLWGADYPHPEGTFPDTQEVLARNFGALDPDLTEALVGGNARRVWLS